MKTVLRFIAMSDLHFKVDEGEEPARFQAGMKMAYDYAAAQDYKKIDALYIVGDFANRGSEGEMRLVKQYIDENVHPETDVTLMLASHEFFSPDKEEGALCRLREIFRQEPDLHKVFGGFHFISVSTERGCRIFDEKKAWIREQLKIAAADGAKKPIFFFQHPHLTDTVYGSIGWGEDDIIPILMDYPQIVDFSGHSHAPVNDPRSIHQKYFTSLGCGSLSYFELDEFDYLYGTVPPDKNLCAQFLIVEVNDDNSVTVKPFDILSGRFFNDGYLIETPWEPDSFIYTDARYQTAVPPVFGENTAFDIAFADGKLHLSFGQALSEPERADCYTVVIRADEDGRVVKQTTVPSSYYVYDMPEKICIDLDFEEKGCFTAKLFAKGFWKNVSAPLVKKFEVL